LTPSHPSRTAYYHASSHDTPSPWPRSRMPSRHQTGAALPAPRAAARIARRSSPSPPPPAERLRGQGSGGRGSGGGRHAFVSRCTLLEQAPTCLGRSQRRGLPSCPPPAIQPRFRRRRRTCHLCCGFCFLLVPVPGCPVFPAMRPRDRLPRPLPDGLTRGPGRAGAHPRRAAGGRPGPAALTSPPPPSSSSSSSSSSPYKRGVFFFITQSAFIPLRMGPSGPPMDGFLTRPGFTGPRARDPARHSLSGPARNHLPGHVPSIRVTHRAHDMTRHA